MLPGPGALTLNDFEVDAADRYEVAGLQYLPRHAFGKVRRERLSCKARA